MLEEEAAPMLNAIERLQQTGVEAALPTCIRVEWVARRSGWRTGSTRVMTASTRCRPTGPNFFDEYRVMPQRVMDAGMGGYPPAPAGRAESSAAGDRVESPLGCLVEIRDTLVARVEISLLLGSDAYEAAGLSG